MADDVTPAVPPVEAENNMEGDDHNTDALPVGNGDAQAAENNTTKDEEVISNDIPEQESEDHNDVGKEEIEQTLDNDNDKDKNLEAESKSKSQNETFQSVNLDSSDDRIQSPEPDSEKEASEKLDSEITSHDINTSSTSNESASNESVTEFEQDQDIKPIDKNGNSKPELSPPSTDESASNQGSDSASIDSSTHSSPVKDTKIVDENELMKELDSELGSLEEDKVPIPQAVNGLRTDLNIEHPEFKALKTRYESLQMSYVEKELEINRLKEHSASQSQLLETAVGESRFYREKLNDPSYAKKDEIHQKQIKEMASTIKKLTGEVAETHKKMAAHDAAAKKAVAALKNELQVRVAEVSKQYEECKRDKEGMVMKYAMAEQRNIKITEDMVKVETRMKEMMRERELMIKKYHHTKTEKIKMDDDVQAKNSEMNSLRKELEKHKELLSSSVTKAKWAENKYKAEADQHKETKAKLDAVQRQMTQSREEAEQVRKDCQAMVRSYQESEEMKSVGLEVELKHQKQELETTKQEQGDKEEVHMLMRQQLDNLKRKHKEFVDELKTYKDKCKSLEMERQHQETSLQKYQETLQNQKTEIKQLQEALKSLETAGIDLKKEQRTTTELRARVAELEEAGKEAAADVSSCAIREGQHLSLQQTLTEQNARLSADVATLTAKLETELADYKRLKQTSKDMETEVVQLRVDLHQERTTRKEEIDAANEQIKEKTRRISELMQEVDDNKDEIKTLKRKHANNVKDILRQLQQAKKRLEEQGGGRSSAERDGAGSMGSRTSSVASLDNPAASHNGRHAPVNENSQQQPQQQEEEPIVQVVEIDKQMLMEKIVRLQKAHARKNEKIEFMEDHIQQLLTEVRKKTRIIQNYAMRDEAGALAPPSMDYNKAQLASKGPGIMAAMYSQHARDGGTMTLELSLEINHKLQALLEDTMLKNITLKENLDTLGAEIARLSQENRKIQLKLQGQSSAS